MINKKAQGEIITTVLIILLVLAAIVIVWQVVNSTLKKGSSQVESQSRCIGVSLELTATSSAIAGSTDFIVKRTTTGGTFTTANPIIIVDGARTTNTCTGANNVEFNKPFGTCMFTITTPTTLEVAYVADDVTCPSTVEWP